VFFVFLECRPGWIAPVNTPECKIDEKQQFTFTFIQQQSRPFYKSFTWKSLFSFFIPRHRPVPLLPVPPITTTMATTITATTTIRRHQIPFILNFEC